MRVLVRALLGAMAELGLHRLHGLAACDRLARHRMPPHLVMAEHAETELLLHELERPDVAVDVAREGVGLREEKLGTAVPRADVPIHVGQDVR